MGLCDCMELTKDQTVSLASEYAGVAIIQRIAVSMAVTVEFFVDTEEVLNLQNIDHVERVVSDMKLVMFPILH